MVGRFGAIMDRRRELGASSVVVDESLGSASSVNKIEKSRINSTT